MPRDSWRADMTRARRFLRPLTPDEPQPPVPPPGLPPARIVEVPGRGEVFVRERMGVAGQPTILLLHGWTASADLNWFRAYDAVSVLGRLVAVDHRGHGRGMRSEERFSLEAAADDAAGVLRELDAGPAVVVGYSMGGPIALLLWHRHPELVAGLVLESTAMEWKAAWRERVTFRFMALVEYFLRLGRPRRIARPDAPRRHRRCAGDRALSRLDASRVASGRPGCHRRRRPGAGCLRRPPVRGVDRRAHHGGRHHPRPSRSAPKAAPTRASDSRGRGDRAGPRS